MKARDCCVKWCFTFSQLEPWIGAGRLQRAVLESRCVLTGHKSRTVCAERNERHKTCGPDIRNCARLLNCFCGCQLPDRASLFIFTFLSYFSPVVVIVFYFPFRPLPYDQFMIVVARSVSLLLVHFTLGVHFSVTIERFQKSGVLVGSPDFPSLLFVSTYLYFTRPCDYDCDDAA